MCLLIGNKTLDKYSNMQCAYLLKSKLKINCDFFFYFLFFSNEGKGIDDILNILFGMLPKKCIAIHLSIFRTIRHT